MTTPPNTATFNTVLASMLSAAAAAQAPSVLRQIAASAMAVFREVQVPQFSLKFRMPRALLATPLIGRHSSTTLCCGSHYSIAQL